MNSPTLPRTVVVIGGGISGLSAAYELKSQAEARALDIRIVLLEAGARPGGKVESHPEDGYLIEWAANGWLGSAQNATDLALQLGLEERLRPARPAAARRYVYRGGRLHLLSANPAAMLTSPLLSIGGRLRLFCEPLIPPRRSTADESVEAFAARRIGPEAARVLISAVVRGIFAGDSRELSLPSAFPQMARMESEYGSLVRALMALRKKHGKSVTPTGPRGSLFSFDRGMGVWAEAFADKLGSIVRTHAAVATLEPRDAGYVVNLSDGSSIPADAVILAADAGGTARLLAPFEPEAARVLRTVPTCGLVVLALAFGPDAFRGPADGYGFLVPRGENLGILGALWESNLFEGRAPEGHSLVRVMIGGAPSPESVQKEDAALLDIALGALRRAAGLKASPLRHWIRRHPVAIPQYTLGHGARVRELDEILALRPTLLLAGNTYRGVAVGACLEDGKKAANSALGALGLGA